MAPTSTLASFAANWRLLMFRGSISVLFGLACLLWPRPTMGRLVFLFSAYALADGVTAMTLALRGRGAQSFGSLLMEGLIGVTAGIVGVMYSTMPVSQLPWLIAAWATARGVTGALTARALRKELSEDWPTAALAALSIIFAVLMMPGHVLDPLALALLFAFYAIFLGIMVVSIAHRLHQLAHEMALT